MPQPLRASIPRLLKRVNNRVHATDDDHEPKTIKSAEDQDTRKVRSGRKQAEKSIPTPPSTNKTYESREAQTRAVELDVNDINADPYSDDDHTGSQSFQNNVAKSETQQKPLACTYHGTGLTSELPTLRGETGPSSSLGSRRGSEESEAREDSYFDTELFEQYEKSRNPKRRKVEGGSEPILNIHAPPQPKRSRIALTYGKAPPQRKEKMNGFKKRELHLPLAKDVTHRTDYRIPSEVVPEKSSGPRFKMPDLPSATNQEVTKNGGEDPAQLSDDAEPLTPSNFVDVSKTISEVKELTTECTYCGEVVDKFLKEEYEDLYLQGKELSFKWQRRFCEYHHRQRAYRLWHERKYPEIDWSKLDKRMRKHDAILLDILAGKIPSHHREAFAEKLKPRKREIRQAINNNDDKAERPGASVGYYGPRGEKLMTDYIVSSMSGELRKRAAKDKLVASAGVQGGVSGFVQSVLVPHLAELLVRDDMSVREKDCWTQVRRIIAESAEVGELINPEAEDRIVHEMDEDG